jgi:type I restriction enzyme S subunit
MGRIETNFKQTEVGLIPHDWVEKTYGEIFIFLKTATYSRDEISNNDEICYIHYGDIHTRWEFHLKVSQSQLPSIPKQKLKNYSLVKDGDLIMADASEDYKGIGKSVEIKNILNQKVISGLHTFLFRDVNDFFINGYRGYIHSIATVKKQFDELATGMKVYGISKNNLKRVKISFSLNKAEQTAIANALSDADDYIESLEKLIDKKQKIKQGAMQQLLKPKPHWEVKKLGDFLDYEQPTKYLVKEVNYDEGNQTPVLTAGKTFVLGYTEEDWGIFENLPVIIFDDFTTAIKYVDFSFKAKSSAMKMLLPKNESVNLRFIYEVMRQIKSEATEHKRHWIGEYRHIEITIPISPEEQATIAKTLSDIDNEITALTQKLTKAKAIKQGMMQQLLTGKIRLI